MSLCLHSHALMYTLLCSGPGEQDESCAAAGETAAPFDAIILTHVFVSSLPRPHVHPSPQWTWSTG